MSIKYPSIPIYAAMYAVNVTRTAPLPLVSGCRNSGDIVLQPKGPGLALPQVLTHHTIEAGGAEAGAELI